MMKSTEYLLLEKMLEKNRRLFKKDIIDFTEYIENHDLIMQKLKSTIFRIEKPDFNLLQGMNLDETRERFKKEICVLKYSLN